MERNKTLHIFSVCRCTRKKEVANRTMPKSPSGLERERDSLGREGTKTVCIKALKSLNIMHSLSNIFKYNPLKFEREKMPEPEGFQ